MTKPLDPDGKDSGVISTRWVDVDDANLDAIAASLGITDPREKARLRSGTIYIVRELEKDPGETPSS